jgi:hypothetical protein
LTTLTGSGTVTIPNPVLYTGQTQTFYNSTGSAIVLSTPSGNFIAPGVVSASSISIPAGSIFTVISDGANYLAQDWLGGVVSTANLVATGGTINGINIGATTTGTGAFSTLNVTSTTTLAGMTATTGAFSGISTFTNTAAATLGTTGTGALQVSGGASIAGILNVGGATYHAGNVSIGTSSTSYKLTVQGDTNAIAAQVLPQGALLDNNDNAGLYVLHQGTAGTGLRVRTDNALTGTIFAHVLVNNASAGINGFQVSQYGTGFIADFNKGGLAANSVRINNSGNMGIGTTSPGATLDMGSRTDAIALPKGTTAQRPTPATGYFRFNTTTSVIEYYNSTTWVSVGLADGSSFSAAAPSASYIKTVNVSATDGVYWLNFTSGSQQPFQAYIVFSKPDGPWVKAIQWNNGTDLSGSAAVNAGAAWTTSQISLNPGKLATSDINVLKTSLSTMWRVTGGSDNLMNNGTGTLKINWTSLPNWGTDAQPQSGQNYDIYLDNASDGTYEYGYRYVPTVQGRCNHTTSVWISDHSSPPGAGSTTLGSLPPYTNMAICWTVGAGGWYTNMHPWSGLSGSSGGSIGWGTGPTTACSIFFKN